MAKLPDETPGERLVRLRARLTEEQREFAEVYLATQSPTTALRTAFGSDVANASQRAHALLDKWWMRDYLAALMGDGEGTNLDGLILTRSEILHTLAGVMRTGGDQDKVRACAVAAKILGAEAPTRHEHTGKNGGPIEHKGLSKTRVLEIRATLMGIDPSRLQMEGEVIEEGEEGEEGTVVQLAERVAD